MTGEPASRDWRVEPLQQLARAIEALTGRPAAALAMRQFEQYLELLQRWNRSQRLTGVLSPSAIVSELFEDSLLFLTRLPPGNLKVADIGAGAGIPGVPIAIVRPEISMTLIESKRKRVSFLSTVRRELGADNVLVLEGRAEQLIRTQAELAGSFDAVVSRSVGPIEDLVQLAHAYLKRGGVFIGGGGPSVPESLSCDGMDVRHDTVAAPAGQRKSRALVLAWRIG